MTLAFSSKHPFVPNPHQDSSVSRWIASVSDGTTVFEDITPHERSAWRRLRDYLAVNKLKLTNLRLEAYGHKVILLPHKDVNGDAQINGYWYSKFNSALLTEGGNFQNSGCGIGMIKGREVYITWITADGTTYQEIRPYKADDQANIINDPL